MKKEIFAVTACAIIMIGVCGSTASLLRKHNNESVIPVTAGTVTEETAEVTEKETSTARSNEEYSVTATTNAAQISVTGARFISDIKKTTSAAVTATQKVVTTAGAVSEAMKTNTVKSSGKKFSIQDLLGKNATQSFLGYRYSEDGYYYCDDKDCWQKDVGYNEVYDKWAPVVMMYIDQVRIRFQYEDKIWMVQLWKGQYTFHLIGAEIGLYTCDPADFTGEVGDINHFYCADKEDWLKMQLDCYYCQGGNGTYRKLFTRPYDTYWWATGFVQGQLTKYTAPREELKTGNRVTFKTEDQANLFVQGLKLSGFVRAAGADKLVNDSYYMEGKDVWVLWHSINHDCFVGYTHEKAAETTPTDA
jgi:hypothetical protein